VSAFIYLIASFAVILAGALLFTNAIEWLGHRLGLGEGATGSVLAAVGTAMPETLIPIVAVIGGTEGSDDVAVGAIIGAPFLLATLAMALVGLAAFLYRSRRTQGLELKADMKTLNRDLVFFLVFFGGALAAGTVLPAGLHVPLAVIFVCAYVFYVHRTLSGGGEVPEAESIGRLYLDRTDAEQPSNGLIALQLAVGLGAIVGGAHLFVEEMIHVAESVGIDALVLSLVLAPLATELPEKVNSFFWTREGKDSLALGNITGAMVFQSTIPVAFGMALTDWDLDSFAVVSASLGLAGGALAYWTLRLRGRFELLPVIAWATMFGSFLVYVIAAS
jgi:cation:H+ antiporter